MGFVVNCPVFLAPLNLLPDHPTTRCCFAGSLAKMACPREQALGLSPYGRDTEMPSVPMQEHGSLVIRDWSSKAPTDNMSLEACQLDQQVMDMLATLTKLTQDKTLEFSE